MRTCKRANPRLGLIALISRAPITHRDMPMCCLAPRVFWQKGHGLQLYQPRVIRYFTASDLSTHGSIGTSWPRVRQAKGWLQLQYASRRATCCLGYLLPTLHMHHLRSAPTVCCLGFCHHEEFCQVERVPTWHEGLGQRPTVLVS